LGKLVFCRVDNTVLAEGGISYELGENTFRHPAIRAFRGMVAAAPGVVIKSGNPRSVSVSLIEAT
jgi:hypothetical protein